jgi:hypothetical protein
MEDSKLYGWLFTYNPYKKLWYAFNTDDKEDYFNGTIDSSKIHSNTDLNNLITVIEIL